MRVGIIGSGQVARALGRGFTTLGHETQLGTRRPEQAELTEWVKSSRGKGSVGSFSDVADFGEIVVVATLGVAAPEAVRQAGLHRFDGKVVIDPTNPLVFHENAPPSLAVMSSGSAGEQLQKILPKARVVKAFNTIGNAHFFRPTFPGGPPDMFLCGNDAEAKKTVTSILHDFGWPSVIDTGGIEGSRELEAMCILWVKCALLLGNWNIGFKVLRK
jgi:8-hydroxy-5-deazaflavin:NADPH oxidoreductase